MDIAAILIGLAIAIMVAAFVAEPLMRKRVEIVQHPQSEIENRKSEEYRATLDAIRDLDFDFQTGKVVEKDYRALREQYVARGAILLQELDSLAGDALEAAIRARRKSKAAQACPACGHPYRPGDRFCGKCGVAL